MSLLVECDEEYSEPPRNFFTSSAIILQVFSLCVFIYLSFDRRKVYEEFETL